jgi:basic amino acid/polyamine antiporter, APA family
LYAYVEVAFGGFVGFTCGVLYWLQAVFTVASVATAFAGSFGVLWAGAGVGRAVVLAALFMLALVNVRGVKPGARLVETITVAKILPLIVLVGSGVWFLQADYLRWTGLPTTSQVGETAIVLIFAFMGITLHHAAEIRDIDTVEELNSVATTG